MTTKLMTCMLTAATLATLAIAQEKKEFPDREKMAQRRQKMMLHRFDKNKNGKLDDAEKAEIKKHKIEFMKKYDKDGDGKLNPEERKALIEDRKKNGPPGGMDKNKKRERKGANLTPEQRQKILKKFDKDGDGKLNQEERKAAMAARKKGKPRGIKPGKREDLIKKYDADGDGKLSKEERRKLHEDIKANAALPQPNAK